MKTIIPADITTSEEAKQFLTDLFNNGEAYHPEDSAEGLWDENNNQVFTDEECVKLNGLMEKIYKVSNFDPCELLMDLGYGE